MKRTTGRDNTKLRILIIYNILQRGKTVSASKIISELETVWDIKVDRKTIIADIREIDRYMPIESVYGPQGGYKKWEYRGREDGVKNH